MYIGSVSPGRVRSNTSPMSCGREQPLSFTFCKDAICIHHWMIKTTSNLNTYLEIYYFKRGKNVNKSHYAHKEGFRKSCFFLNRLLGMRVTAVVHSD